MMPYSKHTNMELLAASCNCIGDLLKPLDRRARYLKAMALRDELRKRTDENPPSDFPSPAEWAEHHNPPKTE